MFSIIHDLDKLSKEELMEYLRAASVHFGLDPDLNALDVIRMPDPFGGPGKLVAYARRGTTDILRKIHGITVDSLTNCSGPGFVAYQAIGHDFVNNRQEIAIGAHDIEGFRGEKLAFAVMTAQTRALRRLTLQFVGGGLLDESEVTSVANLALAAASTAQLSGSPVVLPPPQVIPSEAPGKDITQSEIVKHIGEIKDLPNSSLISEPLVKDKGEGDAVDTGLDQHPPFAEFKTVSQLAAELPDNDPLVKLAKEAVDPLEKKRRPRGPNKKRNTVSLDQVALDAEPVIVRRSGLAPVQTEMPVGIIDKDGQIKEAQAQADFEKKQAHLREEASAHLKSRCVLPTLEQVVAHFPAVIAAAPAPARIPMVAPEPEPQTAPAAPPQIPPEIPLEKKQEYTKRFSQYSSRILIDDKLGAAKMRPSEIGGVVKKLRMYAEIVTGVPNDRMGMEHWDILFEELDGYLAANGAAALVAHINQTLGVKD